MERNLIFVSPSGSNSAEGTLSSPIKTIPVALNRARRLRLEHRGVGVDIVLAGGVHRLNGSIRLLKDDGGTERAPLRIRSDPSDQVVLSGACKIDGLQPVTDEAVLARLSADQRASIRCVTLESLGMPEIGEIEQRGRPPLEVFCDGVRQPIARYPESGWINIVDVPQDDGAPLHEGLDRERRHHDVPVGRHFGRLVYPGKAPGSWGFHREILLHGYWTWDWSDSYQMIERIDPSDRTVHLAPPHHGYGYTTGQRFAFLNIIELVDGPGKWCVHRESKMLYLWPEQEDATYTASTLGEPIIYASGVSHVRIEGVAFAESRGEGIRLEKCNEVEVLGCTFNRLGDTAISIRGYRNVVRSCDCDDLGAGGIIVEGGDRATLTPGRNVIDNNHISNFSKWVHTYKHAIGIDGVEQIVTHNLMHNAPQEAMYFRGNEHLIEHNEIHTVTLDTGDSGAIHTGRDWTWRGTVLRHNLIYGLTGPGLHGAMGIYLDDFMSGTTLYGNIFIRAGRAAFIGGGRDNTVENNIFIECPASVHVDARGTSWAAYYFDGTYPVMFKAMDAMKFSEPPYAERYPELLSLYDDEPAEPKHNRICVNVSFGGQWLELRDHVRIADLEHERNFIADPILCKQLKPGFGADPYFLNIDVQDPYEVLEAGNADHERRVSDHENRIDSSVIPVPGWRDRDFTVDKSIADEIGFTQIPFREIGLYLDTWRRKLPKPTPFE